MNGRGRGSVKGQGFWFEIECIVKVIEVNFAGVATML
jgi:hypothetical protein